MDTRRVVMDARIKGQMSLQCGITMRHVGIGSPTRWIRMKKGEKSRESRKRDLTEDLGNTWKMHTRRTVRKEKMKLRGVSELG